MPRPPCRSIASLTVRLSRSVVWYFISAEITEGFSPRLTPRTDLPKTSDVGFLGECYGLRPDYVNALRKAGLSVAAAGYGWPGSKPVPLDEMGTFLAGSRVVLGIGGVGYSMKLTTLKGRDFEVPGAGGVYLTTYNPDLANFFTIGEEILCYQSKDEMVELTRRLIRDEQWRTEMGDQAYRRSMREHRWLHRYQEVLSALGIFNNKTEKG